MGKKRRKISVNLVDYGRKKMDYATLINILEYWQKTILFLYN